MNAQHERYGRVAFILYTGGIQGENPTDIREEEPLRVVLGMGDVCAGMQEALYDMEIGERRTVVIAPEKGYGVWDSKRVETYPRAMIPGGADMQVGSVIGRKNPQTGMIMPVRVIDADNDHVTMDFNHPWAGKTLEYEVELVSLQ